MRRIRSRDYHVTFLSVSYRAMGRSILSLHYILLLIWSGRVALVPIFLLSLYIIKEDKVVRYCVIEWNILHVYLLSATVGGLMTTY